jgi:glycosyltransferase involved in cell wall biosynthesis
VYHVCSDVLEVVRASRFYRGPRRAAAVGLARAFELLHRRLAHADRTRVVTNGRALREKLGEPEGIAVVSTSLHESDLATVKRTRPADTPPRLLFVGAIRPEKGIDVLVDAFARLAGELPGIELWIAGAQDLGEEGARWELQRMLRSTGELMDRVRLLGHVPYGPKLFQLYADADVVVVPSRSEGTPRVIVEARAFGTPVVASRVGGIPTSIDDGQTGLLVTPGDANALADAVRRVLADKPLRDTLIENGLRLARQQTIEAYARTLVNEARLALEEHGDRVRLRK